MLLAFPATCHLLLPMSFLSPVSTASSTLVQSALFAIPPFNTASSLVLAAAATSTTLQASKNQHTNDMDASSSTGANEVTEIGSPRRGDHGGKWMFSPRASACIYMACAMALHFGGYEFARSGALALFTSSTTGYAHPAAYPFAIGLVTPTSLVLLYWYGALLKAKGPRIALRTTKALSISILTLASMVLAVLHHFPDAVDSVGGTGMLLSRKIVVGGLFVFQNSYAHLLYTQQWSFLGSVMTPSEGTKWFAVIAGLSSLICTGTATMVQSMALKIGLLGLIGGTCLTLALSLCCADQAYAIAEKNRFDPAETMREKQLKKVQNDEKREESYGLISKTLSLFRRVPTLAALFGEVVSFQSLSTVLNVCFVRQLKESLPLDTDRASFTGRLYAYVNGMAGLTQFILLPLLRNFLEPRWAYKIMPCLLIPLLGYLNWTIMAGAGTALVADARPSLLWLTAASFFCLKTLDYAFRNVINEMVFQPLDFDSRYLGKEVIGVFANRFGKSGMSLILSLATATFGASVVGVPQLSQCSLAVGGAWTACSWWLSQYLPTNQEAEQRVQERNQGIRNTSNDKKQQ